MNSLSHKHYSQPDPQRSRQTQLLEYAQNQALFGTRNEQISNEGNSILMRGRIVCKEDIQYQAWIQHLKSIGVDVTDYGITANALSYAYSPELPDNGLRGEITQIMSPTAKSNSENTNIVLAQPTEEEPSK